MSNQEAIKRIAFLQNYQNRPWEVRELIPEVAGKGYHAVAFATRIGEEKFITELAADASRHNLEVMAFTGFMKYEQAWLARHPEQSLRLNSDTDSLDQDQLAVQWGCPYNPDFQQRYFGFLRHLGAIPNLTEVWINDEASLGFNSQQIACYCSVCRRAWEAEFKQEMPRPPFIDSGTRARFLRWRFQRWNDVHARMKTILNHHHAVRAVFLIDPGSLLIKNPWVSGIDPASMVEGIDGIMTDPYYTFHHSIARNFCPREVYLSECCRMLAGICGPHRKAEICAQGFSHGTFTRPLDERDGWWAGIVPSALGIKAVTAYTYTLQRSSPMQPAYEQSFKLDSVFSQVSPLEFAAVVTSLETQCFHIDGDGPAENSWLATRLFPVSEALRQHGLPYSFLPSSRLNPETLRRFPVIILPGITCLGSDARNALREYVHAGGVLIALGETATRDENGTVCTDGQWLKEIFGVTDQVPMTEAEELEPAGDQAIFKSLPWPDETTGNYCNGVYYPVLGLNHPVRIKTEPDNQVLAGWKNNRPGAAVTSRNPGQGRSVFLAGLPSRNFYCPNTKLSPRNLIGEVLNSIILESAGDHLPIRVRNFTAATPMYKLRPLDPRLMPTAEFLPGRGDNLYVATVVSYFKESMRFTIEVEIPPGKKLEKITELTAAETWSEFRTQDDLVLLDVTLNPDDCIKVFAFYWQ